MENSNTNAIENSNKKITNMLRDKLRDQDMLKNYIAHEGTLQEEPPWSRAERINLLLNCSTCISLIVIIVISIILIINKVKKKNSNKALTMVCFIMTIVFIVSIMVGRMPV